MDYYWQVHIDGLPRRLEVRLTRFLFDHGCLGTQEELKFAQSNLRYEPEVIRSPSGTMTMTAFFPLSLTEEIQFRLSQWILEHAPFALVRWTRQRNRDWNKEWKKHFQSLRVAGIELRPVWISGKVTSKTILIEPGMAFGTGTHPTTRFAILMLKHLQDSKNLQKKDVLDVGAGSGILSAVALKLGANTALAVDNDPAAWRESKKTFRINKLPKGKTTRRQLGEIKKEYPVVVANIIDGVLMDLRQDLWRVTSSGGHLILSGILKSGAKAFLKDFCRGIPCRVLATKSDGEWSSFCIQKKGKAS